jgi:hypothetical protein
VIIKRHADTAVKKECKSRELREKNCEKQRETMRLSQMMKNMENAKRFAKKRREEDEEKLHS